MKKLLSKILIFAILMQCIMTVPYSVAAQNNTASIYTNFSGREFSADGGIAEDTSLEVQIVNEGKCAFSGKLFYAFYNNSDTLEGVELGSEISFTAEEESKNVPHTTQNAYPDARTLKVMLWDGSGTLKPLAVNITAQKATGPDGPSSQYKNFGEQPDDKLKAQMPTPFNINNYGMSIISEYDFDDFDFSNYKETGGNTCGAFIQSYSRGPWSIVKSGGIGDSPCVKMEMSETVTPTRFQLVLKSTDAKPGDWYCLKFKVKGEGLTSTGMVRPYLEFQDDSPKNVGSEYGEKVSYTEANKDWTEVYVTEMISASANNIEAESEYYKIYLNAFMENMPTGSAAYIDDIRLYKVVFEPMDTVLVTPNYKGFVYGDNGVCDINLKIYLNDCSGSYNLSGFSLKCSLIDENNNEYSGMQTERVEKENDVTFSSGTLPEGEGDYYLQTVLKDKTSGNILQKQEWTIRKRAAGYRPKVYVDEHNRFIKDGQPVLPMFQYAHGSIYEEYVDVVKNTAVDAFTVAGEYHVGYRTPRMQRLRKSMAENNIGAMLETCGYVYSNLYTGLPATNVKKQSDIRSLLTVMLNNFKDDPRLWVYRNFDEQNAVHYGEELRWQNDIMASVDPDHPTTGITDKLIEGRPGIYSKTADIIGVDPYYCTGKEDQDLSRVGSMIKSFKELNPNRPVFVTLQGFWFYDRDDSRGPTQQEYRNMAWQAVCEGVTAIDNYSYTDLKNNPWEKKDAKTLWEEQMEVLSEIEDFEPALLSTLPTPHYELSGNTEGITIRTARYDGKSYIFAVNVKNAANTLKIKLDNTSSAEEYYTKNNLNADSNGYFSITMEPYGVAILIANQADYSSPHAEIIRFGVSNGEKSYAVTNSDSDNPVILIDSSTTELDYKITASDYASLSINGNSVESQGKINIENLNSITVKAVSQDGRFSTEKTYALTRN